MEKGQFVTVSEWMVHGNIMEYIKHNHANRLKLVRDFAYPAASLLSVIVVARGSPGSGVSSRLQSRTRGPQRSLCLFTSRPNPPFDISKANILMSNDTPPRACLADFGLATLVPSEFGIKGSVPTPEADIYAFGLVIFQVREQNLGYQPLFLLYTGPYGRDSIPWY